MIDISIEDAAFLKRSIEICEAMLVFGAGASKTSRNVVDGEVKLSKELAEVLAVRSGLPYEGDTLSDVLAAVKGFYLSDVQIREILKQEYLGVTPSTALSNIIKTYSWRRLYTWNIDDAIENITGYSTQRRRHYNGMTERAAVEEGPLYLHIVHLHGQISKPDGGFILTEEEYNKAISDERHPWYQQVAQDYLSYTPIFIGSLLAEPILASELERAKRENKSVAGRAFLISPDDLSPIKNAGFRARGIIHIKGTLEDFVLWLSVQFPRGSSVKDVFQAQQVITDVSVENLSIEDFNTARALFSVQNNVLKDRVRRLSPQNIAERARKYLRGFPPTWDIAASNIPVLLRKTSELYGALCQALDNAERLFIIVGQAGSGKTTAAMMCLLQYVEEHPEVPLYEVNDEVKSLRKIFDVLKKVHNNKCIVFVGDAFLYGDGFKQDLEHLSGQQVTIVSTARSSEWSEHLSRYLLSTAKTFSFQKFVDKDYDPLIERLLKYVPSPRFRQLTEAGRREKLARSKSQLLIALREATESDSFTDVITHEFESLPDKDTKYLMIIVGIATLARVGINVEVARAAYEFSHPARNFDAALNALDGIVSKSEGYRLLARHELYVRHIIENVASSEEFGLAISGVLATYIKFKIPVIKSVSRKDGILFKFLLNHRFIYDYCHRRNLNNLGEELYKQFELDFQLDGHYWLQFGLYLAATGQIDESLRVLRLSIDAYPQNDFAVHAHADVQLRAARQRSVYDVATERLIGEAVETLEKQDARQSLDIDQYPLVTLSIGHVGALVRHNKQMEAKRFATIYFNRLEAAAKINPAPPIASAKEIIFKYATIGKWQ